MSSTTFASADLFPWNDESFRANPYPWYARAREMAPVHQIDERSFVVTGYADAMHFAKLPIMSIREADWVNPGPWTAFENTVLSNDPPAHTAKRRLFSRWFTPKLMSRWVELTRESTLGVLDGYTPGDTIDAHFDLGVVPTHFTMSRILDLPFGEVEPLFWALWDAMLIQASDPLPGTLEKSVAGLDYMFDTTSKLLEEKLANPGEGLADELIAVYRRGEITWREVLENVVLFYMSGAPNPAYLVGAAFEVFAEHPNVMRDFRDKPECRDRIINEVARLNPVELIITRFPTEDVEIGGVRIPAESRVQFPIGAVNRDPAMFANPDEFDYERPVDASRNLTFGLGTHACAGQLIARSETEMILSIVAERFSSVTLVETPKEVRTDRLAAYKSLPVSLA
jgi:cytochrome P450